MSKVPKSLKGTGRMIPRSTQEKKRRANQQERNENQGEIFFDFHWAGMKTIASKKRTKENLEN